MQDLLKAITVCIPIYTRLLRKRCCLFNICLVMLVPCFSAEPQMSASDRFATTLLAPLPDPLGVAAPFAGVSDNALIVAGGANFPEPLFKAGEHNPNAIKVWHDNVYVLPTPEGKWIKGGILPRPIAYGVSLTHAKGILCIGGRDAERMYRDVFMMRWQAGKMVYHDLPSLPMPLAHMSGVMIGDIAL